MNGREGGGGQLIGCLLRRGFDLNNLVFVKKTWIVCRMLECVIAIEKEYANLRYQVERSLSKQNSNQYCEWA